MTDQEINIAIAEVCGWKWYRLPSVPSDGERRYRCLFLPCVLESDGKIPERYSIADMTERICNWQYMMREGLVPNYCADLNAMHEAEQVLEAQQLDLYVDSLISLIHGVDNGYFGRLRWEHGFELIRSTARQRAEAFLKTVGKWKE